MPSGVHFSSKKELLYVFMHAAINSAVVHRFANFFQWWVTFTINLS